MFSLILAVGMIGQSACAGGSCARPVAVQQVPVAAARFHNCACGSYCQCNPCRCPQYSTPRFTQRPKARWFRRWR